MDPIGRDVSLNRWSSIVTRQPCIPVLPHVTPGPLPVAVSLSFQQAILLVTLGMVNLFVEKKLI